jgi:transcriptional regulator with GAF, ATPase, and Fis domain
VKEGRFRDDLWFRLNVFPIEIPPLRDRDGDIPALVQHFVERKGKELKLGHTPVLAPGAIEELASYSWPGNVRELENLIERAMILYRDEPLQFDLGRSGPGRPPTDVLPNDDAEFSTLDDAIERHIRRALEKTSWKIHGAGGAGELLGVNPNTLRNKMRKLGIPFKRTSKH